MSSSRKRKGPRHNDESSPYSLPVQRDFDSTLPAKPQYFKVIEQNDQIPSDPITSDPSFFDDYMPPETPRNPPAASSSAFGSSPRTSRMYGHPNTKSDSEEAASSRSPSPAATITVSQVQDKQAYVKLDLQQSPRQSRSTPKRRKIEPTATQEHRQAVYAEQDSFRTNSVRLELDQVDRHVRRRGITTARTLASSDSAFRSRSQENRSKLNGPAQIIEDQDTRKDESSQPSPADAHPPNSLPQLMNKSRGNDYTSDTITVSRAIPTTSNVTHASRTPRSAPTQASGHRKEKDNNARPKKFQLRSAQPSNTGFLGFEIFKPLSDQAYRVKYWNESPTEIGNKWSEASKCTGFNITITKSARVRYTIGDIVSLSFPQGEGGSARIIEGRMGEVPLIIVQWLYSRADAVNSGGTVPRLEQWPQDFYLFSDHFQLVCADNIVGKSGATPIEDFYWAAVSRRMLPVSNLDVRLRKQLE